MDTTGFSAANGNKAGFVELQSEFAKRFFLVANMRDETTSSVSTRPIASHRP
jgi:vitamin B12 transporter